MTAQQAAQELEVSRRWVYFLIKEGKLVATKFGNQWMITRSSLERYRKECTDG